MKRKIYLLIFFLSISDVFATRFLGGDISYRSIDSTGLTYELTFNVYACSDTGNVIVDIWAGPSFFGPVQFVPDTTTSGLFSCHNCIAKKYSYVTIVTYPSPGNYLIYLSAYYRTDSIVNILNSGTQNLIARAFLPLQPFNYINNSPVFQTPSVAEATVNTMFIHNPTVIETDGDSLSYHIGTCVGMPGYYFPPASNSFSIDSITGDLTWDSPLAEGFYSVGIIVREHRNGNLIGYLHRDMLINVCQVNGIDDLTQENGFFIFPNPANTEIKINASGFETASIDIYDVLGKVKYSRNVAGNHSTQSINVSAWSNGVYFVQLKSSNEIKTVKLMVQH